MFGRHGERSSSRPVVWSGGRPFVIKDVIASGLSSIALGSRRCSHDTFLDLALLDIIIDESMV
jgi:hypothetical protein